MLSSLLLVLNILVCIALIGVVLLQRSEGGVLGSGGSPTGLITTRGAGDLLTRTTWILFSTFLVISLALDASRWARAVQPGCARKAQGPEDQSGEPPGRQAARARDRDDWNRGAGADGHCPAAGSAGPGAEPFAQPFLGADAQRELGASATSKPAKAPAP